jgi:hypothetical protein
MLFAGEPQIALLQTASRSIELTFLVSAVLTIASIIPAFAVARYLAAQQA